MAITTSLEYKQRILGNRKFIPKATITLADNTVLDLAEDDFYSNPIKIRKATTDSGEFKIGCAIIGELTCSIKNFSGKFDEYDFCGAKVEPYVGLQLSNSVEWIKKGIYTVDTPTTPSSIINLICLDNMHVFDTPYSDSILAYPATMLNILLDICARHSIELKTTDFINNDLIINTKPNADAMTDRDMISYIAQNSGNFARCDEYGKLELKWYDKLVFDETSIDGGRYDNTTNQVYVSGDNADGGDFTFTETTFYNGGTFEHMQFHRIFRLQSLTINTDDIVITGVEVAIENANSILYGELGYVLQIQNPLIQNIEMATIIANNIGPNIVGLRFRPLDVTSLSDPSIEEGDAAYVSDKKLNNYQFYITTLDYSMGGYEKFTCDAESTLSHNRVQYTQYEKVLVQTNEQIEIEKSIREEVIKNLQDDLSAKSGLYPSEEDDGNGGKIYYLHDKVTKATSTIIWKMTANAIGVSTDGGQTYPIGLTADGDAILNRLAVVGIDASVINVTNIKASSILFGGDNGSIDYSNIANAPEEFTSSDALQAWLSSGYSNYIDSSGAYLGTIVANKITSGTLTGIIFNSLGTNANMLIENGNILISGYNGYLRAKLDADAGYSKLIGMSNGGNIVIGHDDAVSSEYGGVRRDINVYTNSLDIRQNSNGGTPLVRINGSTVITTDNIGSQTVGSAANANYAQDAGGVTTGGWLGLFRISTGGGYISYQDYGDNSSGYVYIGASTLKANNIIDNSTRDIKKEIKSFEGSAINIINKALIRKYKFNEVIDNDDKEHIGLITDEAPDEILAPDKSGISSYAMASIAWKAIQEQQVEINQLKEILKRNGIS